MISPRIKQSIKSEFAQSLLAKIGILLILSVLFTGIFAPLLAPHDPTTQDLDRAELPPVGISTAEEETRMIDGEIQTVELGETGTITHPLGTDAVGRDMLSRVIFGTRTSLLVGLIGTGLATIFGVSIGLVAGYYGGTVDDTLMRGADIMLAFPSLILAIALIGMFGAMPIQIPDPFVTLGFASGVPATIILPGTVTIVVALVNWVWFARITRSEVMSVKNEEYVKSANSIGASNRRILRYHVLPNCLTPIIVLATIQVAAIILLESSLSFLGFSGTTLSWGFDIAQGRDYLGSAWWISSVPGLAIVFTVIGVNLVGDWMRDALDPSIEGEGGV